MITLCGLDGRLEMADALPETGCPLDHALIRGDDGAPAGLLGLSVDSSRFAPAAQIAGGGGCVGLHA